MMRVRYSLGAGLICCSIAAGVTHADEEWTNTRESFICRSSSEVLEIKTYISNSPLGDDGKGSGCRVDYIRNGTTRTIWSSRTSRAYCDGKASSLITKLRAGAFSCESLHLQENSGDR
jgi:hypothetical protein